ncbi:MAG: hypothetical protein ACTHJX_09445 [Terriglobales bacterium]
MRDRVARGLVTAGSVVLIASAVLHGFGGYRVGFPALRSSNLAPGLQAAFRVVFLSLGWHWLVVAAVALLANFTETRMRRAYVLLCGLAVLIEAVAGALVMGLVIGNEMIGAAAVLLVCGGVLLD